MYGVCLGGGWGGVGRWLHVVLTATACGRRCWCGVPVGHLASLLLQESPKQKVSRAGGGGNPGSTFSSLFIDMESR